MSDDPNAAELQRIGLETSDLDGYSLEDLTDYLEAGRTPPNPAIETSPGCRLALDALQRLRVFRADLVARDTAAESPAEDSWVQGILASISRDVRAGRRIPIRSADPRADLALTEGAVRGLIRAAESSVPGVLVGNTRIIGDVTVPDAQIQIGVDASVPYGERISELADRLRAAIGSQLRTHTDLNLTAVDIRIQDVQRLTVREGGDA